MENYKYSEIKNSPILGHLIDRAQLCFNNHEAYNGPKLELTYTEAYEFCDEHFSASSLMLLPAEFLDNERFMRDMIDEHYPITDPPFIYFASERLKNDKNFMSHAIKKHGGTAARCIGPALANDRYWLMEEMTKLRLKTVELDNAHGVRIQFLKNGNKQRLLAYSATVEDTFKEQSVIYNLLHSCNDEIITEEFLTTTVEELFYVHQEDEIFHAFSKAFNDYVEERMQKNIHIERGKKYSKLVKFVHKISKLPAKAKIREAVYKKRLAKNIFEQNGEPLVQEPLQDPKSPVI